MAIQHSPQNGKLAGRASTTTLLTAGFSLYALGFLAVALAGTSRLLIGGLLVFGAGSGLVTPTLFTRISVLAPEEVRAGVMSLQTTTIGISQAVGPALFALLGGTIGYQGTLLSGSAGAAVGAAVLSIFVYDY
ncbi:MFS transporter [Halorubrum salsamenti]|uniref:MFS transporter n=1 Tax=Halorubrum salsamenti TaxID=2583990 RepID=UPI0011A42631|nr:MFS transporter [Halorubrum salsamenti]